MRENTRTPPHQGRKLLPDVQSKPPKKRPRGGGPAGPSGPPKPAPTPKKAPLSRKAAVKVNAPKSQPIRPIRPSAKKMAHDLDQASRAARKVSPELYRGLGAVHIPQPGDKPLPAPKPPKPDAATQAALKRGTRGKDGKLQLASQKDLGLVRAHYRVVQKWAGEQARKQDRQEGRYRTALRDRDLVAAQAELRKLTNPEMKGVIPDVARFVAKKVTTGINIPDPEFTIFTGRPGAQPTVKIKTPNPSALDIGLMAAGGPIAGRAVGLIGKRIVTRVAARKLQAKALASFIRSPIAVTKGVKLGRPTVLGTVKGTAKSGREIMRAAPGVGVAHAGVSAAAAGDPTQFTKAFTGASDAAKNLQKMTASGDLDGNAIEVGWQIMKNAAKDAINLPANILPMLWLPAHAIGQAALSKGGNTEALDGLIEQFLEHDGFALLVQGEVKQALRAFGEHPLFSALELSGGIVGGGRIASKVATASGSVRYLDGPGGGRSTGWAGEERVWSPNLLGVELQRIFDKRSDKTWEQVMSNPGKHKLARAWVQWKLKKHGNTAQDYAAALHVTRQVATKDIVTEAMGAVSRSLKGDDRKAAYGLRWAVGMAIEDALKPGSFHADADALLVRYRAARTEKRADGELVMGNSDKQDANQSRIDSLLAAKHHPRGEELVMAARDKFLETQKPFEAEMRAAKIMTEERMIRADAQPRQLLHEDGRYLEATESQQMWDEATAPHRADVAAATSSLNRSQSQLATAVSRRDKKAGEAKGRLKDDVPKKLTTAVAKAERDVAKAEKRAADAEGQAKVHRVAEGKEKPVTEPKNPKKRAETKAAWNRGYRAETRKPGRVHPKKPKFPAAYREGVAAARKYRQDVRGKQKYTDLGEKLIEKPVAELAAANKQLEAANKAVADRDPAVGDAASDALGKRLIEAPEDAVAAAEARLDADTKELAGAEARLAQAEKDTPRKPRLVIPVQAEGKGHDTEGHVLIDGDNGGEPVNALAYEGTTVEVPSLASLGGIANKPGHLNQRDASMVSPSSGGQTTVGTPHALDRRTGKTTMAGTADSGLNRQIETLLQQGNFPARVQHYHRFVDDHAVGPTHTSDDLAMNSPLYRQLNQEATGGVPNGLIAVRRDVEVKVARDYEEGAERLMDAEGLSEAELLGLDDLDLGVLNAAIAPGEGVWHLIPRSIYDRHRQHLEVQGAATNNFLTQGLRGWVSPVLTSSPNWPVGNFTDITLRGLGEGILPPGLVRLQKSHGVGEKLLGQLEGQGGQAIVTGGFLAEAGGGSAAKPSFGLTHNSRERIRDQVEGRKLQDKVDAVHESVQGTQTNLMKFMRFPVVGNLHRAYRQYADTVFRTNHLYIERDAQVAMLGKVHTKALRNQLRLWEKGSEAAGKAHADLLEGKLTTAMQVRYAKEVQKAFGNWTTLSPTVKNVIGGYAPFFLWMRAAARFVYVTMPTRHPIITAIAAAGGNMTDNERKLLGLDVFHRDIEAGLGPVPPQLMGGIPQADGSIRPTSRLTSFGVFAGGPVGLISFFLPQYQSAVMADQGMAWYGGDLKDKDGQPIDKGHLTQYALASTFESFIPFVPMARRLAGWEWGGVKSNGRAKLVDVFVPAAKVVGRPEVEERRFYENFFMVKGAPGRPGQESEQSPWSGDDSSAGEPAPWDAPVGGGGEKAPWDQ